MKDRKLGWIWIVLAVATIGMAQAGEKWPQWGGLERNFTVQSRSLSRSWGDSGPPQLWSRPLGGGFASVVSDGRRLYVTYRDEDDEVVAALNRKNGKTRWEHRSPVPIPKSPALSTEYGEGPNGTPLLEDGKLVTLGFTGLVRCLDAKKGSLLWSHDLEKEFEVKLPYFGHATSPLAVGNQVIVVAGGLFAFDLDTGEVAWQNREFEGSYGSPMLVTVDDRQQIVTPVSGHLAGFDAETGKTLWSEEHKNQWGTILTTPIIDDAGRVFISAAQAGSMLVDPGGSSETRRIWSDEKTQVNHSNAVRSGNWVFASVGESASFMTATSLKDGKQAWKTRGFGQSNLVRVGDEFLLLDFEGELALIDLGPKGMKVIARASINDKPTWTPPTLIGTTLYVRDESRVFALDLSAR